MNKSYWAHVFRQRMMEAENDGGGTPEGNNDKPKETPIPFEELLKNNPAYQSEFDRRMSKGLDTAKMKWQEETQKQVSEAEKLAKMTAEQKAEHERQKREDMLNLREKEIQKKELKAEAYELLTQKGLPKSLIESVSFEDAQKCKESIESLEKAFRDAVQEGVETRLKGTAPLKGAQDKKYDEMTDDEYYASLKK